MTCLIAILTFNHLNEIQVTIVFIISGEVRNLHVGVALLPQPSLGLRVAVGGGAGLDAFAGDPGAEVVDEVVDQGVEEEDLGLV